MPNLELERKKDLSIFRKIAIGTWSTSYNPQVYGTVEVKMDKTMDYIEAYRKATGKHLTVTHMMARVVAETLKKMPDANAILRFNHIYRRKKIGIFMQVVLEDEGQDKIDLSGVTIYDVDKMTVTDIVNEVEKKVESVRKHKDPNLEKSRNLFHFIPHFMLNFFLKLISFLSLTLNLDLSFLGLPKDPFGSIMITNIGTLGLDMAYAPLVPYSKVPMVIATGAVKEQPVVENGEIVIRKMMKINATFDHRFIDGYHAAVMSKTLRDWLENPFDKFTKIPEPDNQNDENSEDK